ncbi:PaaI family thioesterase [Polynucleobacter necessarius]|uniref:PaaI family thioesterase n=1 Tax=Polynucleobacter necessarius TaxID=576610 RepID=UPI0018D55438
MGKGEILLALKPENNNTWEVAHGGVLLTLMDVVMAVAARSSDPGDRSVVTIEMKNNFMQAAPVCCELKRILYAELQQWPFVRLSFTTTKVKSVAWLQGHFST